MSHLTGATPEKQARAHTGSAVMWGRMSHLTGATPEKQAPAHTGSAVVWGRMSHLTGAGGGRKPILVFLSSPFSCPVTLTVT